MAGERAGIADEAFLLHGPLAVKPRRTHSVDARWDAVRGIEVSVELGL